jgi:hypothetical protein
MNVHNIVSREEIDAALKQKGTFVCIHFWFRNFPGYIVIKNFLTQAECDLITEEVEAKIAEWFTRENLVSHAAYISDDNIGRRFVP